MFNLADREHKKFIYNDAAFFMTMTITDGALFKYKTLNKL